MDVEITHEALLQELDNRVADSSQTQVAAKLEISRQTMNDFVRRRLPISDRVANAMGYEVVKMYRKIA